jgi:hypothetical protein
MDDASESTPPLEVSFNPQIDTTPTVAVLPGNSTTLKRKKDLNAASAQPSCDDDYDDENEWDHDEHEQGQGQDIQLDTGELSEERKNDFHTDPENPPFRTFREVFQHLETLFKGRGWEAYKGLVERLEKTPYFADCLQRHIGDMKEILGTVYQITDEDNYIMEGLDTDRAQVYLEKAHRNEIEIKCGKIVLDMARTASAVERRLMEVKTQLQVLSGLSQAHEPSARDRDGAKPSGIDGDGIGVEGYKNITSC